MVYTSCFTSPTGFLINGWHFYLSGGIQTHISGRRFALSVAFLSDGRHVRVSDADFLADGTHYRPHFKRTVTVFMSPMLPCNAFLTNGRNFRGGDHDLLVNGTQCLWYYSGVVANLAIPMLTCDAYLACISVGRYALSAVL